ncbi:MAG: PKD domain-containing protein [Acidobacteria bacterium]|nr:PKD domain-containing protein [Acidobacteriota bacterium]
MLALIVMVSAQKKSEDDPRNTAPTFGTGGPVGGPTGLFTVYDGSTLRKGEFTFSAAYSNYDRDPGDVDISEIPVSFQLGITNNFEIFFNTDAYRGIKVNSPRNLSGFYLPNNSGTSLPAVVLAPGTGQLAGTALFRPSGNQVFVQYPYVGGTGGLYGFDLSDQADFVTQGVQRARYSALFGTALGNIQVQLGPAGPGGAANVFPGIGSVYGGILPGLVLTTTTIPGAFVPVGGTQPQTVPGVFTLAPSYLNDAPMLNRKFGESSFSTFTVGAKWRLTSNSNPIGFGVIPFYRFYADSGSDAAGFNQLQRGASPGGQKGDFGAILFADSRLRKWVNVSANVGYIYNSDIEGQGGTVLLDRGDELLAAFGVDFPVNKYFQPIFEFRSNQYVGGRTPNAFENNPLEGLAGVRVFPARWLGFSLGYRYHANQQDRSSIEDSDFNGSITVATANPLAATQVTTNFTGVPPGFRTSSDPHGFFVQGFIGRRDSRGPGEIPNQPAQVTAVNLSKSTITLGCPAGQKSESNSCDDDKSVNVTTSASDPENDPLTYNYTVSGGRIVGTGSNVSWDLSGVGAGTYTITAGVDDGCGVCGDTKTATVEVKDCPDCKVICECPSISVSEPAVAVNPGENMTFTANVSGGSQDSQTYNWTVNQGTIVEGQGSPTITVSTSGLVNTTVTAEVEIGGLCDVCTDNKASGSGIVAPKPNPVLRDEFGKLANDDVKARLDPYASDLQADPNATGYIVNYGSSKLVAQREKLIRDYLVKDRGIDSSRLVFVNGGVEPQIRTRLWIVPAGADSSSVDE